MIDGLYSALNQPPSPQTAPTKVLRMVKNERMGGSVPIWETIKPGENLAHNVENALSGALDQTKVPLSENALGYHPTQTTQNTSSQAQSEEFSFGDLIDMINPLHHLPVVGHVYRELTGDEIKPIGKIMGGAIFGGPLGAASGLANVIVEYETGKDLAGNAFAMAFEGKAPTYRSQEPPSNSAPEIRLAAAQDTAETHEYASASEDLPGNLLSFVDMKAQPKIVIERAPAANGRTAGAVSRVSYPDLKQTPLPRREPITQVRLSYNYND
ncbi:MAG: hypothetical protein H6861_04510 [Rhodospirillales bacterium]|nr:hypothetical protein [Rhodospirillales bacterium]